MAYHSSQYPYGGGFVGRLRAAIFGIVIGSFCLMGVYLPVLGVAWAVTQNGFADWHQMAWRFVFASSRTPWILMFFGSLGGVLAADYLMWIRMTGRRILPFR
jgi:hypothetical protein